MSTRRQLIPALQGLTLVALSAAAWLLVQPIRVDVPPGSPVLAAVSTEEPPRPASAALLTDSVVNANIFSLAREAPDERTFVAAPSDSVSDDVTAGEYSADAGLADSAVALQGSGEPVPALYGVVNGPMGRAALLRLDASGSGSRLFRLGEGTAGYRVRSIGADRVELIGPAGPVVLELVAKGGTP